MSEHEQTLVLIVYAALKAEIVDDHGRSMCKHFLLINEHMEMT